ncbi:MAG: YbhN family protein [Methanohalobium sp.]|uniref:lysylphosphatidylglycerol synthase transmembrane domain-containing protein n=1 Tax=Methanohalobium sp. TaxID=2837493 RepID=UPI00397927A9
MNKFDKWLPLSLLISIISIIVVLLLTVDPTTLEIVKEVRTEYLLIAVALHSFSYVIWGTRTHLMSRALGYKPRLIRSIEIVISSTFVAALTPSSVGGEPLRVHLLHQDNLPVGCASAVVLGERMIDALLILMFAPFALYIFRDVMSDSRLDTAFVMGQIFMVVVFAFLMFTIWKPEKTKSGTRIVANKIAGLLGKKSSGKHHKLIDRIDHELEQFHESLLKFLKEGRKGLFYGAGCTILFWVVEFSMLPIILLGLNQDPPFLLVYAAQVLLLIIIIIPATPGASGVAEIGATTLFSVFVPASILGIIVVAWRALTFYMNLIVGGIVSFKILKDTELMKKLMK